MSQRLELTTWCSGVGAAWAERRTNITANGEVVLEAVVLWVPVDSTGHPVRINRSSWTPTERRPKGARSLVGSCCANLEPRIRVSRGPFVERTWTWWAT